MGLRGSIHTPFLCFAVLVAIARPVAALEPEQVLEKSSAGALALQTPEPAHLTAAPASASPPVDKPDRAAWMRELRRLAGNEAFLNGVNPYPPGTAAYVGQNRFLTALFSNERFIERFATSISSQNGTVEDQEAFSRKLVMQWIVGGLRRLDDSDKESLLSVYRKVLDYGSTEQCATMIRGDPLDLVSVQLIAKMDAFDVEAYYLAIKHALFAEIEERPEPTLTQEQEQLAKQALAGWANRLDPTEAQRLRAAFSNLRDAPDSELCWSGKKVIDGILNLQGEPRDWLIRLYFKPQGR